MCRTFSEIFDLRKQSFFCRLSEVKKSNVNKRIKGAHYEMTKPHGAQCTIKLITSYRCNDVAECNENAIDRKPCFSFFHISL